PRSSPHRLLFIGRRSRCRITRSEPASARWRRRRSALYSSGGRFRPSPIRRFNFMSQDFTSPAPPRPPLGATRDSELPKSVFLVSYPKIVFLYPTFIAAILAGLYLLLPQNEDHSDTHFVSAIFMAVFAVNLVVFAFDFPRTTSLTLFFFLAALILGMLLLF